MSDPLTQGQGSVSPEQRAERAEQECDSLRAQLRAALDDLAIARGAIEEWIARCRRAEATSSP